MFDEPLGEYAEAYLMQRFAKEGIPPSEFKALTWQERERIIGIWDGVAKGQETLRKERNLRKT